MHPACMHLPWAVTLPQACQPRTRACGVTATRPWTLRCQRCWWCCWWWGRRWWQWSWSCRWGRGPRSGGVGAEGGDQGWGVGSSRTGDTSSGSSCSIHHHLRSRARQRFRASTQARKRNHRHARPCHTRVRSLQVGEESRAALVGLHGLVQHKGRTANLTGEGPRGQAGGGEGGRTPWRGTCKCAGPMGCRTPS
jgi:hypothetical protein